MTIIFVLYEHLFVKNIREEYKECQWGRKVIKLKLFLFYL